MIKISTRNVERETLADIVKKQLKQKEVSPAGPRYAIAARSNVAPKVLKITRVKGPVQPATKLVIGKITRIVRRSLLH